MEKPQYCRVSSIVFRHSGFLWKSVCREIGLENVINRIYQNALFGYSKERELYMKRKMLSSIMTVSYTHLDVYKRQPLGHGGYEAA